MLTLTQQTQQKVMTSLDDAVLPGEQPLWWALIHYLLEYLSA